jgi:hypothetical protein
MVKAPTLLLKYALGFFINGLGIYFGCLAFSDVGSQKPRGRYLAIFIVYMVTVFLGLLIYYVPSTLKELELSPARRYAQIMTNELAKKSYQEETDIIQRIGVLLNSEEQETYEEHLSDDAISWVGRLENMDRCQYNPADGVPIQRTNEVSEEAAGTSINLAQVNEETAGSDGNKQSHPRISIASDS